MTPQEARAALIKQSRRDILDALKPMNGAPLSFESLRHVFPDVPQVNLRNDVTYLEAKRYIERVKEQANQEWDEKLYRLTASGIEVADKINLDPALEP